MRIVGKIVVIITELFRVFIHNCGTYDCTYEGLVDFAKK